MKSDDLDRLTYIPALRSRQAELRGYRHLTEKTKANLHPIISVGRLGPTAEPERVAEKIVECVGGSFFLDLNTFADQQCEGWQELASAEDNFKNWRTFGAKIKGAVPLALIRDGAPERAFVRQVLAIEQGHEVVVIRSRRIAAELPLLQAAISAVEDVNNVLVVLDLGYIRAAMDAKEVEANRAINALRDVDPTIRIAILSSSFPRSVAAYNEHGQRLEILERDLHARLGGSEVAIYGDHASIYPDPYEASIARWVPRIDYPTAEAWIYRRHRDDDDGFYKCAQEIVALPDWDPDLPESCWGAARIAEQSKSKAPLPKFGSPSPWISVRVNIHLERQAEVGPGNYEEEED